LVDLIFGVEALAKFGTIFDFQGNTIQLDNDQIAMRSVSSLSKKYKLSISFARDHLKSIRTREAIKQPVELLDTNYIILHRLEVV
jgi:hypothetical protein